MPLNKPQEEFIQSCLETYVEEFIDESCTQNEFFQQIEALKLALSDDGEETIEDFVLYNCLRHPEVYLLKLEQRVLSIEEKPITISDAQEYILRSIISPGIIKKAQRLDVNPDNLWNCENIITHRIPKKNKKMPFKSEKSQFDSGSHPDEFAPTDKIFSVSVYWKYFDDALPEVHAYIRAELSPGIIYETNRKITTYLGPRFDGYDENAAEKEEKYMKDQLEVAIGKAKLIAANHALMNYQVTKTRELKNQEVENLIDRHINSLINSSVISVGRAINLSDHQKKLLSSTYYHKRLKDGSLKMEELLGEEFNLSKIECKILLLPPIINLLNIGAISLAQAKKLPLHFLTLLAEEFYYNLIIKSKTPEKWEEIFATEALLTDPLLNPIFIQVISEYNCHFTDAILILQFLSTMISKNGAYRRNLTELTKPEITNLFNPVILDLLKRGLLPIRRAIQLNNAQRNLLVIYHAPLIEKDFTTCELIETNINSNSTLINPSILKLIQDKKITLLQAKMMSPDLLRLMSSDFYVNFIFKDGAHLPSDTNYILTTHMCNMLLDRKIMQVIRTTSYGFSALIKLIKKHVENYGYTLSKSLITGKTSIEEIKNIHPSIISIIDEHPLLSQLQEARIISVRDISNKSFSATLIEVQALCLLYVFKQPFAIVTNSPLHQTIQDGLNKSASLLRLSEHVVKESTLKEFLLKLKHDMRQEPENTYYEDYIQTITKSESAEKTKGNANYTLWHQTLNRLIRDSALDIKKMQPPSHTFSHRLFTTKIRAPKNLEQFHQGLRNVELSCETREAEELTPYRSTRQRR